MKEDTLEIFYYKRNIFISFHYTIQYCLILHAITFFSKKIRIKRKLCLIKEMLVRKCVGAIICILYLRYSCESKLGILNANIFTD